MNPLVHLLEHPDTVIAVVGATDDSAKYGSVVYRDLKRKGYTVFAVNPNRDTVDGDPAYNGLSDLPRQPDIINFVVPATAGLSVAEDAKRLGFDGIWLQPGADSPALVSFLQQNDFEYLADACIMVRSRWIDREDNLP